VSTVGDYANELNDFYGKIKDLKKAVPREFGYKLDAVLTAYHEMFSRFCPFKVGDRVQLKKAPKIDKGSGWSGSQHFLVEGAKATVKSCDWHKNQFVFTLEFDNESWIDSTGKIRPVTPEHRHVFGFGEGWIVAAKEDEISNPTDSVVS
jgi:hypothetical protein